MTTRDIPPKYRAMYKRAMSGKSRKAAMRIFCLECVYYSEMEVSLCTDPPTALCIHIVETKPFASHLKRGLKGLQNDDPSTIEKKIK